MKLSELRGYEHVDTVLYDDHGITRSVAVYERKTHKRSPTWRSQHYKIKTDKPIRDRNGLQDELRDRGHRGYHTFDDESLADKLHNNVFSSLSV
jgi:hypothetical protein